MSINFSIPKSEPNPASVTTYSPSFIAASVAITELQPCAILANGPPCTNAGFPSRVCTRFGLIASFKRAVIAPSACKSLAVIRLPDASKPTVMLPKLSFNSSMLLTKQRIAMTSDATTISNLSLKSLSLVSITRLQVTSVMPRAFPWCM